MPQQTFNITFSYKQLPAESPFKVETVKCDVFAIASSRQIIVKLSDTGEFNHVDILQLDWFKVEVNPLY